MRIPRRAGAALAAGVVTAGTTALLRRSAAGGTSRWTVSNFRGDPVSLLEGPATVAGLAVGSLLVDHPTWPRRVAIAAALTGAGAVGAYDDSQGAGAVKGLHGHLRALASREVTSGAVKIAGVGAAGWVCAAALQPATELFGPGVMRDTALVAGTANLVNLLDLRPGRALKTALAAALIGRGAGVAGPVVGSAVAALPDDLRARTMLGDCGANPLGAALGCMAVAAAPTSVRWALLAIVTGLTLVSERVSFSSVIERYGWLRRLDDWGQPAAPGPVSNEQLADLIG